MTLFCTRFPIESKITRAITDQQDFLEGSVFEEEAGCFGLFLFVYVGRDIASREWLWMAIRKEEPPKNGFSFAGSHLPCRKFIWSEDFLFFLSLIGNYSVFLRSFLFTFFRSFDRESFFSFLFIFYFPSFHFFLFFLFIPPSPFLSLGDRVLAIYLLSLEEIPLSFASGERMRILFIGQGSK